MQAKTLVALALTGLFAIGGATLGADEMTLTGTVGDAACGVTHKMPADAAKCTLACVGGGSDFALIVADTAYTLETSNEDVKAELEKLAGMMATITGDVTGETIAVASVDDGALVAAHPGRGRAPDCRGHVL